jgi:cytochrome c2
LFSAVAGPKCASCHSLDDSKKSLGPNLSQIGDKLGKDALLD